MRVVSVLLLAGLLLSGCGRQTVPATPDVPLYERADLMVVAPLEARGETYWLVAAPDMPADTYPIGVAVRFEMLRAGSYEITLQVSRDGNPLPGGVDYDQFTVRDGRVVVGVLAVEAAWQPGVYEFRVELVGHQTVGVVRVVVKPAAVPPATPN